MLQRATYAFDGLDTIFFKFIILLFQNEQIELMDTKIKWEHTHLPYMHTHTHSSSLLRTFVYPYSTSNPFSIRHGNNNSRNNLATRWFKRTALHSNTIDPHKCSGQTI